MVPDRAAGHYDRDGGPAAGRNALEWVVSSYTSTVRALVAGPAAASPQGRQPTDPAGPAGASGVADSSGAAGPEHADARLLVVRYGLADGGQPPVPETTGLETAGLETAGLETAADELGYPGETTTLTGADATVAAVTAALTRHRRVHFACHGAQLLDSPSQAALHLADGELRLPYVPTTSGREFAFLAACSTSTGGRRLPNEVLTMSAAFQHAGWRRVVGTLWPVYDQTAADLTRQFYAPYTGAAPAGGSTAAALREAVLAACRQAPHRPDRWAGYVHIGPTE